VSSWRARGRALGLSPIRHSDGEEPYAWDAWVGVVDFFGVFEGGGRWEVFLDG